MFPTLCALIVYFVMFNVTTKQRMHNYIMINEDTPFVRYGDYEYYYLPNNSRTTDVWKSNHLHHNYTDLYIWLHYM
jgi:hypothetical protein